MNSSEKNQDHNPKDHAHCYQCKIIFLCKIMKKNYLDAGKKILEIAIKTKYYSFKNNGVAKYFCCKSRQIFLQ